MQLDEDAIYEEKPKVVVASKEQASKPSAEETKTQVKPAEKAVEAQPASGENNLEDMYEAGDAVKAQEVAIEQTKRTEVEAFVAFIDEEFLLYDFNTERWELGDYNDSNVTVPDNAAIVKLDSMQTSDFQAIAVGGIRFGKEQSSCLAV